ncbi:MAG: hypothetical protein QM648_07900 [Solirubrobacterales bacterium]
MSGKYMKLAMFALIFVLGAANIVVTLANGGGVTSVGFVVGAVLCALAAARIYLSIKDVG